MRFTPRRARNASTVARAACSSGVGATPNAYRSCIIGAEHLYGNAQPIRALGALPFCQWGDDLLHLPDARWIAEHAGPDAIVLRTSSIAAQLEAARAGVAVLLAGEPFADLAGLCRVPIARATLRRAAPLPELPLFLVGHQALRRVPRIAAVWTFLEERFAAAADAAARRVWPAPGVRRRIVP